MAWDTNLTSYHSVSQPQRQVSLDGRAYGHCFRHQRPYHTRTPRKRPAREMDTDDKAEDEEDELTQGDMGTVIQEVQIQGR